MSMALYVRIDFDEAYLGLGIHSPYFDEVYASLNTNEVLDASQNKY